MHNYRVASVSSNPARKNKKRDISQIIQKNHLQNKKSYDTITKLFKEIIITIF